MARITGDGFMDDLIQGIIDGNIKLVKRELIEDLPSEDKLMKLTFEVIE